MKQNPIFNHHSFNLHDDETRDQKCVEALLNQREPQVDIQDIFQDAYFEEFLNNIH